MGHSFFKYRRGMEPVPGYTLMDRLGEGGFGEVWKANSPGHIPCAIKIIDLTGREGVLEFRSLRLVKALDHANINPITGIWLKDEEGRTLDDGQWSDEALSPQAKAAAEAAGAPGYSASVLSSSRSVELIIAMRLCAMSLHKLLQEYKRREQPGVVRKELLVYMEDAARAIDYLNSSKSIIHSDIKPQNILISGRGVTEPGTASICDFGLARVVENLQKTQEAPVTVYYAAPEAFKGKGREASDQYSLAITYIELRTGQLPFPKDSLGNFWEVYEAHKTGKLDLSMLPPAEREIIARATAVDPDKRWKNCRELVTKLRETYSSATADKEGILDLALDSGGAPEEPGPGSGHQETSFSPLTGVIPGAGGHGVPPGGNTPGSGRPSAPRPVPLERGELPDDLAQTRDSNYVQEFAGDRTIVNRLEATGMPSASAGTVYPPEAAQETPVSRTEYPLKRTTVEPGRKSGPQPDLKQQLTTDHPASPRASGGAAAAPPQKSRALIYAIGGIVAVAVLAVAGVAGMSLFNPDDPKLPIVATENLPSAVQQLVQTGEVVQAAELLQQQGKALTEEQQASLWKDVETAFNTQAETALAASAGDGAEVERLFEAGRRMKRSTLTPTLTKLFKQRVSARFNAQDYSGAKYLLTDSQNDSQGFMSRADVEQLQTELYKEWLASLSQRFAAQKYDDVIRIGLFLQEIRSGDADAKLWVARAELHNKNEAKARSQLGEIVPDKLSSYELRTLHRALIALADIESNRGADRNQLKELQLTLSGATNLKGEFALDATEKERLQKALAAGTGGLAADAAKKTAEGDWPAAEGLWREIAAFDTVNPQPRLMLVQSLVEQEKLPDALQESEPLAKMTVASPPLAAEVAACLAYLQLANIANAADRQVVISQAAAAARKADAKGVWGKQVITLARQWREKFRAPLLAAITADPLPPTDKLKELYAMLAAYGDPMEPAVTALALEGHFADSTKVDVAQLFASAKEAGDLADYVNYVVARSRAAELADKSASAEQWKPVSEALLLLNLPAGGPAASSWITAARKVELARLFGAAIGGRGLKSPSVPSDPAKYLAPGFSPFGSAAECAEAYRLLRGSLQFGDKTAQDPALQKQLALAAWYAEPRDAATAQAAFNAVMNNPQAIPPEEQHYFLMLAVPAGSASANDDGARLPVMKSALTLASASRKKFPAEDSKTFAANAALAFQVYTTALAPAFREVVRPQATGQLVSTQREFSQEAAEYVWAYRLHEPFAAEIQAGVLEQLLNAAIGASATNPRLYYLRALSRLGKTEPDFASSFADAKKAIELGASAPEKERAAYQLAKLLAIAGQEPPSAEAAKTLGETAMAVEAAVTAKLLPNDDFSEPYVWQALARAAERTASGNLETATNYVQKALAAEEAAGSALPPRQRAELQCDLGRLRFKAYKKQYPTGAPADAAAKAALEQVTAALNAALKADPKQELPEARAWLARVSALSPSTLPEAHANYLAAVKGSAGRSAETLSYLRDWARLPLLPKSVNNEKLPPPAELEKLLSSVKPECKPMLRLICAKAHLRQLAYDPVVGLLVTGNVPGAEVYLNSYAAPPLLDDLSTEWLHVRMAVRRKQFADDNAGNTSLLNSIVADADRIVSSSEIPETSKALALAYRGIAKTNLAYIQVQNQIARSGNNDLAGALALEKDPPASWRISFVDSFIQAYETKGGYSNDEQQRALAQADLAIEQLRKADAKAYAEVVTLLEKKKDRIKRMKK